MTNENIAIPMGKTVYLDANVIINLIQYSIAERENVLDQWPSEALKTPKAALRLLEAGSYQMQRARAGIILEDSSPRFHASILTLAQAAHALQLYGVMANRVKHKIPYRQLTIFSNIDKEVSIQDLEVADNNLSYFLNTWLEEKKFKNSIILHPISNEDADLFFLFSFS
jgi:aromatic ring-cleaving dioxygenase